MAVNWHPLIESGKIIKNRGKGASPECIKCRTKMIKSQIDKIYLFSNIRICITIILFDYQYNFQTMLISPNEYLGLTDQLALLNSKCKVLEDQNVKLNAQVIQQNQNINLLNQRLAQQIKKNQQKEIQLINFITNKSDGIVNTVTECQHEQMKFVEQEIQKIKSDANVQKIRQLEKKMTDNRFKNHQMVDFYQKIQSLYMVLNNTRTTPSMNELYKWATLRKADQVNVSTISNGNNLQGTQKSILNNSKMNMSKMNMSKMNKSKMNGSRIQIVTSNFNNSNVFVNTGTEKPIGMRESRKNLNTSQFKTTQKNKSPMEKNLNMSKMQTKGKQNNPSIQKPPKSSPPIQRKKRTSRKQNVVEIHSTESLTQQVNFENEMSLTELENKMSIEEQII